MHPPIDQFHDDHHHPALQSFAEEQLWRVASIGDDAMGISVVCLAKLDEDWAVIICRLKKRTSIVVRLASLVIESAQDCWYLLRVLVGGIGWLRK